jgi:hypothetical protein
MLLLWALLEPTAGMPMASKSIKNTHSLFGNVTYPFLNAQTLWKIITVMKAISRVVIYCPSFFCM